MKPHIPVLLHEAVDGLLVAPGKRFIDATYGGGGHAKEIVRRGGEVLGIDTDPDTEAVHGNFRDIQEIAQKHDFPRVDGILFDLGISSHQLDTPERGFSYRFEAPLDMRLNQSGETAAQYLKRIPEQTLGEILERYGEVRSAQKIAHTIKTERPTTTSELLALCGEKVAPQVFQAIRIGLNDELESLRKGLDGAKALLKKDGRLVVISFHSLEDRIVKQFLQTNDWKVLTKKPIVATYEERRKNKRARSAKLRIAQKI